MIYRNTIKQRNPRNSKGSACQKAKKIHSNRNVYSPISKKFIYKENHTYTDKCTHKKVYDKSRTFFRHISFSISVFITDICFPCKKKNASADTFFLYHYLLIILSQSFFLISGIDGISRPPHQTSS